MRICIVADKWRERGRRDPRASRVVSTWSFGDQSCGSARHHHRCKSTVFYHKHKSGPVVLICLRILTSAQDYTGSAAESSQIGCQPGIQRYTNFVANLEFTYFISVY